MQRLTTFSKLMITIIILAALFFGYQWLAKTYDLPTVGENAEATSEVGSDDEESADPVASTSPNKQSWDFKPAQPIGGKLKGVVELGASGFNSFIVKIDSDKNWELEKAEWGNSLVYEGLASGTDVTQGLKQYIGKLLDYGVASKEIHFVVSSGAMKAPETKPIIDALKKLGFVVNEVTPEQEGTYALKCVLPKAYENSAFVVDIGSGNTKVSWMENGRVQAKETLGSKSFQDNVAEAKVYGDAKKVGEMIPVDKTKTCFIIGGVPFTLAKQSRVGNERFTVIGGPDDYSADEAKTKAGLSIYKGLKDGTGCDLFVFDWDANFTIGFLLTLPY